MKKTGIQAVILTSMGDCFDRRVPLSGLATPRGRGRRLLRPPHQPASARVSRMESLAILLERASRQYTAEEKQEMADRKKPVLPEPAEQAYARRHSAGSMKLLAELRQRGIKIAMRPPAATPSSFSRRSGWTGRLTPVWTATTSRAVNRIRRCFCWRRNGSGVPPEACLVVEDAEAALPRRMRGHESHGGQPCGWRSARRRDRARWTGVTAEDMCAGSEMAVFFRRLAQHAGPATLLAVFLMIQRPSCKRD